MDLFQCAGCSRRYVVPTGTRVDGRPCRVCGGGLELVVRSIPGSRSQLAAALDADRLDPDPAEGGESGQGLGDER